MKNNKRKLNKKKLLFILIIILILLFIIVSFTNNHKSNDNSNNDGVSENINVTEELRLNDIAKPHDDILALHGKGSDNYNIDNKVFATTYISNILGFDSVNIFYYNDDMTVKSIEYILSNNSIYEVLDKLKQAIGSPIEYDAETEELSTIFKWKYEDFLITLKNNISQVNIIIE